MEIKTLLKLHRQTDRLIISEPISNLEPFSWIIAKIITVAKTNIMKIKKKENKERKKIKKKIKKGKIELEKIKLMIIKLKKIKSIKIK